MNPADKSHDFMVSLVWQAVMISEFFHIPKLPSIGYQERKLTESKLERQK